MEADLDEKILKQKNEEEEEKRLHWEWKKENKVNDDSIHFTQTYLLYLKSQAHQLIPLSLESSSRNLGCLMIVNWNVKNS